MAATASSRWSDTFVLRETTLKQTLPRVGKTAGELYRDVQDDFGSCGERRFYRILRFLVDGGFISAAKEQDHERDIDGAVTLYFRVRDPSELYPAKIKRICRLCGMLGTHVSSHPLHLRKIRELRGAQPQYATLRLVYDGKHVEGARRYYVLAPSVEHDHGVNGV